MNTKFIKEYVKEIGTVILFLLFLHLLDPFSLAHYIGYVLIFIILLTKSKKLIGLIDHEAIWIFLFSLTYTAFNALGPNKGLQYLIIQLIFPVIFYLLGKHLVTKKINQTQIIILLITIGSVFSITTILSVGSTLIKYGFVGENRNLPNFWTGKIIIATGLSAFLTYNLLLPGILLVLRRTLNKWIIIILTIVYIISLLCVFRLGSRTCIVISGAALLIGFAQVLASQNLMQNLKFLITSIIIVFILINFIPFDLNADYLSVLGDRLQDKNASSIKTAGNRTGLWLDAVNNLFKNPLGWNSKHYAHNVWLDIARVSGIIPLFFFLLNTIAVLINLKKIYSLKKENLGITTTFCLYFFGIILVFFTEPILEGTFFAVTLFFLFQGILKKYSQRFNPNILNP